MGVLDGLAARLIPGYRALHPDLRKLRVLSIWMVSLNRPVLGLARAVTGKATSARPAVSVERRSIPGFASSPAVVVLVYRPTGRSVPSPVVLWVHGGGFVFGAARTDHARCSGLAHAAGAVVVSVEYRLAPEHRFPAALDDVDAALRWIDLAASELDVDPARMVVAGASAGAGLVASVVQRARDRGAAPARLQLLLYPMLDDRTVLGRDANGRGRFGWTPGSNRFGWSAYLGHPPSAEAPPYAAAARAEDLAGLPPAWIGVGGLDLFQTEDSAYASRLRAAGVACDLVVVDGAYHGFDAVDPDAPVSRRFTEQAHDAVRRALAAP
jgi:acetyl esterase/lipase